MTHFGVSVVSRVVSWKKKKKVVILHRRSVSSASASVSSLSPRSVVVLRGTKHGVIVADLCQEALEGVSLITVGGQRYPRRRLASSRLSTACGLQGSQYGDA